LKSKFDDPNIFLCGNTEGMVQVCSIKGSKIISGLNGHKNSIESIDISKTHGYFATGSLDGTIKLWDPISFKIRDNLNHEEGVTKVMFSENNNLLYSCSTDSTVCVWDIRTGKNIKQFFAHKGNVNDFDIMGDNSFIFSCGDDSKCFIFNMN